MAAMSLPRTKTGESVLPQLVQQLCRGNPQVLAALLVDEQGRALHQHEGDSELVNASVSMVLPLRELLEHLLAELGCGALQQAVVEGSAGSIALADVDGRRTVMLIGAGEAAPGALRSDARWLSQRLAGPASDQLTG